MTLRVTKTPATYKVKVEMTVQCTCAGKDDASCMDEAEQELKFREG